jgi:tight adherence protein B
VRLTAAALGLGVEAGGEVARSVDRVAATLRERRELQAEAHSLATQARASATVLGLAPLGFTALVSSVEPGVVRVLVASPVGWLCLGGGLALDAAGLTWMSRIVRRAT